MKLKLKLTYIRYGFLHETNEREVKKKYSWHKTLNFFLLFNIYGLFSVSIERHSGSGTQGEKE